MITFALSDSHPHIVVFFLKLIPESVTSYWFSYGE
jgi:hypothetical protein